MLKKILVPLDGSTLSECSLDYVKEIAIGCQIHDVVLLRVVEPPNYALMAEAAVDINALEQKAQAEAEKYITSVSDNLKAAGIKTQTAVVKGRPGEQILLYADKNNIDLILMSTHGRTGVTRWAFGSVADRVVRHATTPVLTISPPGCRIPFK